MLMLTVHSHPYVDLFGVLCDQRLPRDMSSLLSLLSSTFERRISKYAFSDDERDSLLPNYEGTTRTQNWHQRYKVSVKQLEQLWETTMDPETRTMLKVTVRDAEETNRMFEILMGEDVPDRRAFIERHAKEVTNLTLMI